MDRRDGPMVRVLLVGKGAPERGGIPSFLEMLVDRLPALGVEVELLNLADEGARVGGSVSVRNLSATARDLARIAGRAGGFDIVHVHSACAPAPTLVRAGMLCAAARARGARTVLHVHGGLIADWLQGSRKRRLVRWALAGVDHVVAVADGPARALSEAVHRSVPVLPNGVDLERFSPADHRPTDAVPTVLMVGGLTPRKGVLDLLDASALLLGRGLAHRLVLAGGTPDDGSETQQRVVRAIEAAGTHVTVVPPVPHGAMPGRYREADVFCLPSWWEAQPLSLLEAMACGLPAVVTEVGDVREMTAGGEVASVVAPRDVPALADGLGALLGDADRRLTMGRAARRHVEAAWGVDRVIQAIADTYGLTGIDDDPSRAVRPA